jgi:O-antigen ligase
MCSGIPPLKAAALVILSLAFGWTLFQSAGVEPADLNITVFALAVVAPLALRHSSAPPLEPSIAWCLALLPFWVVLQLLPLPPVLVGALSPARAELASAIEPARWTPLSAFPVVTLSAWLRLAGCVLLFLAVRELAWYYSDRGTPWRVILPLIFLASLEAVLGLVQFYTGSTPDGAHGTYHNRDHFSGLMELALPFPIAYGWASWHAGRSRRSSPLRPALFACVAFALAALILLAAIHSLSRMGFLSALFALAILGIAAVPRKRWLLALPVAALAFFIYLPPNQLIERFADLSTADKLASQDRLYVWRETLPMISSYRVAGCGLGTFESVFPRFKRHAPLIVDNFAHNDYLQYLAELGTIGFSLGLLLLTAIVASALRATSRHSSIFGRALAVASLASLGALLFHSVADFNTYIPANAFACAWISAIAASANFSSRPLPPGKVVLELNPSGY